MFEARMPRELAGATDADRDVKVKARRQEPTQQFSLGRPARMGHRPAMRLRRQSAGTRASPSQMLGRNRPEPLLPLRSRSVKASRISRELPANG